MTKNRTPTPVYLDPGMHSGLEVKGLNETNKNQLNGGLGQVFNCVYGVHKLKTSIK